jgi:DNA-binding MurR/RpiR family transcriptional regulator
MARGPRTDAEILPRRTSRHVAPLTGAGSVEKLLIKAFDSLSPQLQTAGRYLLDHPQEVALRSMRELAREAKLAPATMTRLARQLGFSGFEDLKKLYAEEVRLYAAGYRTKAIELANAARDEDASALATGVVARIARQVDILQRPETILSLVECARLLGSARTIYCLGQRLSFPPAYTFQYIHSVAGGSSVLLDAPGGVGLDPLRHASTVDAVLAISVLPYTRSTVEQAVFANQRGIPVVAITDSEVSPLVRLARHAVKVSTKSQSFFQTMVAVSAAAETLATMIAMRSRERVLDGLKESEEYFAAASTYWSPSANRNMLQPGNLKKRSKRA